MKAIKLFTILFSILVSSITYAQEEDVVCKIYSTAVGNWSNTSEEYIWGDWKTSQGLVTIKSDAIVIHGHEEDMVFYIAKLGKLEEQPNGQSHAVHQTIYEGERVKIKTIMGWTDSGEIFLQFYFFRENDNEAIVFQGRIISSLK